MNKQVVTIDLATTAQTLDVPDQFRNPKWLRDEGFASEGRSENLEAHALVKYLRLLQSNLPTQTDWSWSQAPYPGSTTTKTFGDLADILLGIIKATDASVTPTRDDDSSYVGKVDFPSALTWAQHITYYPFEWDRVVDKASTIANIVGILRRGLLEAIANRISYLDTLASNDPSEPRVDLESLRGAAKFLLTATQFPEPLIGLTSIGRIYSEWRLPTGRGILGMEFLESGDIRYSALLPPEPMRKRRKRVKGTKNKDAMLADIQPFTTQLENW